MIQLHHFKFNEVGRFALFIARSMACKARGDADSEGTPSRRMYLQGDGVINNKKANL